MKQNLLFDYETKLIFWLRNKTYFFITKQNLFLDSETKLIFWLRNKTYFLITTQNLFFYYETKLIFWFRYKTYFLITKQNLFFDSETKKKFLIPKQKNFFFDSETKKLIFWLFKQNKWSYTCAMNMIMLVWCTFKWNVLVDPLHPRYSVPTWLPSKYQLSAL